MEKSDYVCLNEFLYQAIFIPQEEEIPARSIINDPEILVYIKGFGDMWYGIGTKLMKKLIKLLKENGYNQTSLSVQKTIQRCSFISV